MIIIYIRHYFKEYSNRQSSTFPYDPKIINDNGNITNLSDQLVKLYGIPNIIFTSPYERTRQTAQLLKSNIDTSIIIDNTLSEYINDKYNVVLNNIVRPDTFIHNPPINETRIEFINRIKKHQDKITNLDNGIYWIITHGLFIKKLLNIDYPNPLEVNIVQFNNNPSKIS